MCYVSCIDFCISFCNNENMRIIKKVIKPGQKPTAKQIEEIEKASLRPIVFDEDSPEFTYEEMLKLVKETKKHRREDTTKQVVLRSL